MAFDTGIIKLNITEKDSSYDFTVVQGESEVTYSGGLDADIVWDIKNCAKVELKAGSTPVSVESAILQTIFALSPKKKEKRKGKVALVEAELRELKTRSPDTFNQVMRTFLRTDGLLFLSVGTNSTTTLPLDTSLLNAPLLFAVSTGQNAVASMSP